MTIYDDLQPVVRDVMSEFKQGSVVYVHSVAGSGPEDDPGEPTINEYEINATANGVKFKYVQGGQALSSDLQVVAPVDIRYTPTPTGFVKIDGVKYKIHKLLPKPAAGTPVAYVFIVRK
jgi:hypothetical protein